MPQEKAGRSDRPKNSGPLTPLVPKSWLEIEKIRPIGFIGKDILALEKKMIDPSEIIKQNQGFEISRLLLTRPREQEQHPGIDR